MCECVLIPFVVLFFFVQHGLCECLLCILLAGIEFIISRWQMDGKWMAK
jgi:hypothetical protein